MTVSKHPTRGGKTTRGIATRAKLLRKGSVAAARKSDKPAMLSKPLVAQFFDPRGFVIVDRVAERFGMSKQQFAETIGVKPETVYRVTRALGSENAGSRHRNAGNRRPYYRLGWRRKTSDGVVSRGADRGLWRSHRRSLVKEGKAAAVRDYLDHIATGGFA